MTAAPDFDRLAASYDRLRPADPHWWELVDAIVEEGDLVGRRVLDVGCGTGRLAHALAERGARVWGIDPSPEMLARARAKRLPGGGFKQASAERLPFKDEWFEGAVLRQVVHLLDRPRAFPELARVLRPGGRAVIATFAPEHFGGFWLVRYFPAVERIDRVRFPVPGTLTDELGAAGFGAPHVRKLVQRGSMARAEALERLRGRYISTLHLLDEAEYREGLARAERELPAEVDYELHWVVLTADRGPA